MNYESVYRTAPATPGLLKTIGIFGNCFIISSEFKLFANLPDNMKAARSIKNPMDILR